MRQDHCVTKNYHLVCINLEPVHFEFLREHAKKYGKYSDTIHYLLNKYLNHLYKIRITPTKRTETTTYQPVTKRYIKRTIDMNPVLWSKMFEMRHFVGYSISALIRIMIEWEMQEMGYDIIPLMQLPILNNSENDITPSNLFINNYFYQKQGFYESRKIISIFWDEYS